MIRLFSNNIDTTLADELTDSATTMVVANDAGLSSPVLQPSTGALTHVNFGNKIVYIPESETLTLLGEAGEVEVVRMTARTGTTLTVVRGQEGTTAQAWAAGSRVVSALTKMDAGAFLQNLSTHASGIAIDDPRMPRSNPIGISSADAQHTLAIGVGCMADWEGATAIAGREARARLYSTALGTYAAAAGTRSMAIGWAAIGNEGDRTTLIGSSAITSTHDATLVGQGTGANRGETVVIGAQANSQQTGGIVVGYQAKIWGNTATTGSSSLGHIGVCVGYNAEVGVSHLNNGFGCTAVGGFSKIGQNSSGAIAIGHTAEVTADNVLGICLGVNVVTTPRTLHISALPAVPTEKDEQTTSDSAWAMVSSGAVIMSVEVDLTVVADVTALIWDGLHFFPDEVGLVITAADGVTGQPTIRFGVTGTLDKLLAATATTGLDAAHKRQRFQTLASSDGETTLTAGVTVAATGTTLKGRFYWRGFAAVDTV